MTPKTQITKQDTSLVNQDSAERLISQAIDKNVDVATMEKLLAMRRELKAEYAKEQFDKAMANFQAQCPTIDKTKEVRTGTGQLAYKYAPIESIVEQVKKYLQNNGFSYSTNMELIENGTTKVKVTIKVTHEIGHSETTEMTVPLGNKTNVMSQTQVVAAAQTFAKRYAFCNAFGILTGDEDTDARPLENDVKAVERINIQPILPKEEKEVKETFKNVIDVEEPPVVEAGLVCSNCEKVITQKVYDYSVKNLGKALCFNCQKQK